MVTVPPFKQYSENIIGYMISTQSKWHKYIYVAKIYNVNIKACYDNMRYL